MEKNSLKFIKNFNRMNATPKEKEQKEYEMGLARGALGALKRKRQGDGYFGGEGEGESTSKESEVQRDVAKFELLKWKDEMAILPKRRKKEKSRDKEIIQKKKAALAEEINAGDSEAEDDSEERGDETEEMEIEDPLGGLGGEVMKRKVTMYRCPTMFCTIVLVRLFGIFLFHIFTLNACKSVFCER